MTGVQTCALPIWPKGERKPELSLAPLAKRLGELLNQEIKFSPEIRGQREFAQSLSAGEILLLENIRYESAETSKDEAERNNLAQELAKYGDIYIGDGFAFQIIIHNIAPFNFNFIFHSQD